MLECTNSKIIRKISDNAFANSNQQSYYSQTLNYSVDFPKLANDAECDICIIGGGLTGISTALHLVNQSLKQSHKVILLEAETIGAKASGLNGGQVKNGYECGMKFFERKFGGKIAKRFWDLSLDGLNIVKTNIQKYNIDCAWQSGIGVVAYRQHHLKKLKNEYLDLTNKYNCNDVKLYGRDDTCDLTGSSIYHGMLYDSDSGHLNPLNYLLGLAKELKNIPNINVYEHSPVTKIEFNSHNTHNTHNTHNLTIDNKYTVKAKIIVLAANYANDVFLPDLKSATALVDTFVLATDIIDDKLITAILKNKMAVFDTRLAMSFYRLTNDNRLLFGGGDAFGKYNIKDVQVTLYRELLNTYPQLAGIKIQNLWSGIETLSLNLVPVIGMQMNNSVYYAKGYSGHGPALTNLTGRMIADSINGDNTDLDLFAQIKPFGMTSNKFTQDLILRLGIQCYKFSDKFL